MKLTIEEIKKMLLKKEENLLNETCCFTGHRIQKLPW